MIQYRLFVLDSAGRIDRGFEQRFRTDDEAIQFAGTIEDATLVEVMRERTVIARVRNHGGRMTVVAEL